MPYHIARHLSTIVLVAFNIILFLFFSSDVISDGLNIDLQMSPHTSAHLESCSENLCMFLVSGAVQMKTEHQVCQPQLSICTVHDVKKATQHGWKNYWM